MSYENRKMVYEKLIKAGREIPEDLFAEFGKVKKPKNPPSKPKPTKKKKGEK